MLYRVRSFLGKVLARENRGQRRSPVRAKTVEKNQDLESLRRQLQEREREIKELQTRLSATGPDSDGVGAEDVVWIFCTARSGSTWLGSMLGDLPGSHMWDEPLVGALFGDFYYKRAAHKRGAKAIMGQPHRSVWLKSIRSMVLEGATARYPGAARGGRVVIKEPHGSVGAPLLMEALPESGLVFLVRDPRDVVSSAVDAQRKGSWTSKNKRWEGKKPPTKADTNPDAFVEERAETYVRDISKAKEAYDTHGGRKVLIRYEDLRSDTLGSLKRIRSCLGIPVSEEDLVEVVDRYAWENIAEEEKGQGKFYRKASPGGWREDLTPEQAETVKDMSASFLDEFYPGWRDEDSRGPSPGQVTSEGTTS